MRLAISLVLTAATAIVANAAAVSPLEGSWTGNLMIGGMSALPAFLINAYELLTSCARANLQLCLHDQPRGEGQRLRRSEPELPR